MIVVMMRVMGVMAMIVMVVMDVVEAMMMMLVIVAFIDMVMVMIVRMVVTLEHEQPPAEHRQADPDNAHAGDNAQPRIKLLRQNEAGGE